MGFVRTIAVVDSHTGGEPTRVVQGGLQPLRGNTLAEKKEALLAIEPAVLPFLVGEPRGHSPVHTVIPVEPCDPTADVSILIGSAIGVMDMCGHALIGAVTTFLETGTLPRVSPTTHLRVETLAGIVEVAADVEGSRVRSVKFRNVPAWVLAQDLQLDVPGVGLLNLSLVYAGLWYAVVDVQGLDEYIELSRLHRLIDISRKSLRALNDVLPDITTDSCWPTVVSQLLYIGPGTEKADGVNLATATELGFDRSPCGTGSSARMALAHARGELKLNEEFVHQGITGSTFTGRLVGSSIDAGGHLTVIPEITGSASLTAFSQLVQAENDPVGSGFYISASHGDAQSYAGSGPR